MDEIRLGSSLATRTTSGFPLSIATSMAFESLFKPRQDVYDPTRIAPEHIDIFNYQEMFINLTTLFRNIIGAVDKDVFLHADDISLKETLEEEIDVINSLFMNEGNNTCKPIYYFCDYRDLYQLAFKKKIKMREDKTDYQKFYRTKLNNVLELLMKDTDEHIKFNSEIKPTFKTSSLILSHVPYDLTSYKNFSKLDLLESHTGKLKPKFLWNSKYYPIGDNKLTHFPFFKKLLLVLGDKTQIHASDYKLRKLILDISIARNWTPMTTMDKIKQDFTLDIREAYVLHYLLDL